MIAIDALARQAISHCSARLSTMDRLLEALVRIPSPTPSLEGNRACLEVLSGGFDSLGFASTPLVDQRSGREHLHARHPGPPGAPKLVLLGHTDTVHDDPSTFSGFWTEDGRARGPGVEDMKGGLVVILAVLDTLAELGLLAVLDVHVFLNTDEEQQSRTSRRSIRGLCSDAGLVLGFKSALPSGAVISSRRGTGRFLMRTTGRASHAGFALHEGRNAILELASKIPRVEQLTSERRGVSVNCGVISGGSRANVVPAEASLLLDVRCDDPPGAVWIEEQLRAIAADVVVAGCETTVRGAIARPPWPDNPGSRALMALWRLAARATGVGELQSEHAAGSSDTNLAWAAGAPVLDGLGPRGGGAHSRDEWIDLQSLPQRAAMTAVGVALWREKVEEGLAPPRHDVLPSRPHVTTELQLMQTLETEEAP